MKNKIIRNKINRHYNRILKKNRTTIINLIVLIFQKEITIKKAIKIHFQPIEIYFGKYDSEELLTTHRGLKMVSRHLFLSYKNELITK